MAAITRQSLLSKLSKHQSDIYWGNLGMKWLWGSLCPFSIVWLIIHFSQGYFINPLNPSYAKATLVQRTGMQSFLKTSKPCLVDVHCKALPEYSKLATSSIRVKACSSNSSEQCLSQDIETGCLKLAVVKFLGVQIYKGEHKILIFQP